MKLKITIDNHELELVDEAAYLGVIVNKNGAFDQTKNALYKKGLKAIFKLQKQLSPLPKPSTCLHLFNHIIKPVLLYGCEVWAYSLFGERNYKKIDRTNIETIYNTRNSPMEKALIKYGKMILQVPSKTTNLGVYGELGIYPLYIDAVTHLLKYWNFIENRSPNLLVQDALKCSKELHMKGTKTWYTFALHIKQAMLSNQSNVAPTDYEIISVKRKLKQRYINFWRKNLYNDKGSKSENGNKLRTYRTFKLNFEQESYLNAVKSPILRRELTKFRLSTHRLNIELGRHTNVRLEDRLCTKCECKEIEDEKHFLFTCPLYENERNILFKIVLYKSKNFKQLRIEDQLCWLISNKDDEIMHAIAKYIHSAMEKRSRAL